MANTQGRIYHTIGEVAQMLNVNTSTLRYWETEFDCIRPSKTTRGERRYTQGDIDLLRRILYLTHERGFTLEGAREELRKERHTPPSAENREIVQYELVQSLGELKRMLNDLYNQL